jgi:REP element-mobilizing transposase RayT
MYDPKIWRSRGYLPHIDDKGLVQFITFRLADSVPRDVIERWHDEQLRGEITDATYRRRIETYLDQGYGSGDLKHHRIAQELQETLLKWDGERYRLLAWVIMPNHANLLLECSNDFSLASVMHSIKSYTAHKANHILDRKGRFWSKEYFDRYIRDRRHYTSVVKYIEDNPVKARLCRAPEEWPFSSARGREVQR